MPGNSGILIGVHSKNQCQSLSLAPNKTYMKNILKEFREFAMRGNVLDLAIAVIIAGAFGAVVTSAVNDLLMPLIARIMGEPSFAHLSIDLGKGSQLMYGNFIQKIIDFLVVAFAVFMVVKTMNSKKLKKETPHAAPAETSNQEKLLMEIRDLLKNK
jgi:large conductance mechanosensitive channel